MGKRRADPSKGKTLEEMVAFRDEFRELEQILNTIISAMEEHEMDFFPVLFYEVFNSKWPTVREWVESLPLKFKKELRHHHQIKVNAARDAARAVNNKGKKGKKTEP